MSAADLLRLKRDALSDGEDQWFQPSKYQLFSREPIIFYKALDGKELKWKVSAGEAFKRKIDNKIHYYIPF